MSRQMPFSACDCWPQDIFNRWCSDTVAQWRSQLKIFLVAKTFYFRRTTVFSLGFRLSKRKWLLILKIWGGMAPGPSPGFSSRGDKNQKGGHIFIIQYWMYAATEGHRFQMGWHRFQMGGPGTTGLPAGDGPAWPSKTRCFILREKKHDWIRSSASTSLKNPL